MRPKRGLLKLVQRSVTKHLFIAKLNDQHTSWPRLGCQLVVALQPCTSTKPLIIHIPTTGDGCQNSSNTNFKLNKLHKPPTINKRDREFMFTNYTRRDRSLTQLRRTRSIQKHHQSPFLRRPCTVRGPVPVDLDPSPIWPRVRPHLRR